MTDRPILFSAPMVRALLAGTKTQTRRLASSPLARVEVGDRLYVREHWRTSLGFDALAPKSLPRDASIQCIADGTVPTRAFAKAFGKHRQAMHMPRWASRLTLIVTDKRFQPLQDIHAADAQAEGCEAVDLQFKEELTNAMRIDLAGIMSFTFGYQRLWDSLHDADGQRWLDNPDVVALTFRVVRGNIDQIGEDA